ncbi:tripartite tricarboxylate transporter substrate binding protein [Xylophilus rhododendri]|uniref:Tripartite tricarboxylate transporter substrate binding protein n=1 Tax=Xylophilus rhododendri TaxID=2697032 RepID=A0A857J0N1_9BURK|nr:tripartite tricarboxylate transporter substrate binding protein [Xylophilus rhododendri]QHI97420.1 tripartite tricarboxylate transporter substrate binding protein [Xylophilus rhododendri]
MSNRISYLRKAGAALFLCGLAALQAAHAEYPDRPVRFIVPAVAGGAADVLTRVLCSELAQRLGQPFIVDNKPGASGAIGLDAVAKAPPDGYTIGMNNLAILVATLSARQQSFRIDRDFTPIAKMFTQPNVLAVYPALPVHSVKDLVAYAKAHPGEVFYGSSGTGTSLHVVTELFRASTGIQINHVPYRSAPLGETDLMGGQIQMMISNLTSLEPQIKAGRVRALAVTGPQRSPLLPDVPTMAEAGVPQAEMVTWGGVVGPKGLPAEVVRKLNAAIDAVLSDPRVVKRYGELGSDPTPQSPAQFAELIQSDSTKWGAVIKNAHITSD